MGRSGFRARLPCSASVLGFRFVGNGKTGLPLLQDARALLGTPNAISCELHSLSFKFAKRTVLGFQPAALGILPEAWARAECNPTPSPALRYLDAGAMPADAGKMPALPFGSTHRP